MEQKPKKKRLFSLKNMAILRFVSTVDNYLGKSSYGFCFVDNNGIITYVNEKAEQITSYTADELKGLNISELAFIKDGRLQVPEDVIAGEHSEQSLMYETSITKKSGEELWLFFTAIPIKLSKSGKSIGHIVFIYDQTAYKKMEKDLQFAIAAFKSISEGMFIISKDLFVTDWNETIEKMSGFPAEKAVGKYIFDFVEIIEPGMDEVLESFNSLVNDGDEGTGNCEYLVKIGNSTLWIELFPQLIRDKSGALQSILYIVNDITERKRIEEKMRFSDAAFKSIQESVIAVDNDGIITHWNAVSERIYGIEASEAIGRPIREVIESQNEAGVHIQLPLEEVNNEGYLHSIQLHKTKAAEVWVAMTVQQIIADGRSYGWVLLCTDITQPKIAEKQLRESEANLAKAQSIAGLGSWHWDFVPGEAFWSDEFFRLFGYQPGEVRPSMKLIQDAAHPEDRDAFCRMMEANIRNGKTDEIIVRFIRKGGEIWYANVMADGIWNQEGKLVRVYGYIQDITKIKLAEEREKQMQLELENANRLASIGEMASGLAHELNNPLTGVIGFSQLLLEREMPEDIRENLEIINREAQRAARIVSGLLTFAHQRELGRSMANINDIIVDTIKMRAYEFELSGINVFMELDGKIPLIAVDAVQIQQVFLNIILNTEQAIKSTCKPGSLTVKTGKTGEFIRITFIDDGPGIRKEDLPKIFNPFFTTKEVGQGTGLGLSISHGIVARHRGKIHAESILGKGTEIVVELPVIQIDNQYETVVQSGAATRPDLQKKGLIIDDEAVVISYLKSLLVSWNYHVETVNNGHDAVKQVENNDYDFILLDIKMPKMNGIEIYHSIIGIKPALKQRIIVITGDVLEKETQRFIAETGIENINKPVKVEELKCKIHKILERNR
jgi:PAS domain S-box-containing protein